jgi:arginine exporter protein ArgO
MVFFHMNFALEPLEIHIFIKMTLSEADSGPHTFICLLCTLCTAVLFILGLLELDIQVTHLVWFPEILVYFGQVFNYIKCG